MIPISRLAASLTVVVIAALALRAIPSAGPSSAPLEKRLGPGPVVVELFTSQGCSSCPPADALIRGISRNPALQGRVIPLAFHVDYWNYLGWRDPFSSAEWSRRQMFYAHRFSLSSSYTPQAIVGGATQFVGSNAAALDSAIVAASQEKREGNVVVTVAGDSVTVRAEVPPSSKAHLDVMLALVENDVTTSVVNGENGGRTLVNDAVVRDLARIATVTGGRVEKTIALKPKPEWNRKNVSVVAFLQDHATLAIHGAAAAKM